MLPKLLLSKAKNKISITIMPSINELLEKVSRKSGLSKSALIEKAVAQYLEDKLEEDIKALSKMHFDDLPSEDEWLEIQSKI